MGSDTEPGDFFGHSVAMSGEIVAIGANRNSSSSLVWGGAAYVFERHQGGIDNWGQIRKLTPSFPQEDFGWSVGISNITIVAGAIRAGTPDSDYQYPGAVYIYNNFNIEPCFSWPMFLPAIIGRD